MAHVGAEFVVGLLYPWSGPAGIFGPSCVASARLAADDINSRGGLLGRQVRLEHIDASQDPAAVARTVAELVRIGALEAVVGWHRSDVRRAVADRIAGSVPYVYTALYEGGEHTDGLWLTGETPTQQVRPAMQWMQEQLKVGRWLVVGSEYLWPRQTARSCQRFARDLGVEIAAEIYRPVGHEQFDDVMKIIECSGVDGVLQLQLGQDAVHFNRCFAAAGLDSQILRFSPLTDECMLLASGAEATRNLYVASGFFNSLVTDGAMTFNSRYYEMYGPNACPPSAIGESCLEGMLLLESLVQRAGSADLATILASERPQGFESPRGSLAMQAHHADQPVYLATAAGHDFDVLTQLPRPSGAEDH